MANEDKIFEQLNYIYKNAEEIFGKNNIFGVYAYGKVNTDTDVFDIKTEIIYIPTVEEMCFETHNQIYFLKDKKTIARDIRKLFSHNLENNLHTAEIFFTKYYIINSKYKLIFDNVFIPNKDRFIENTKNLRIIQAAKVGLTALQSGDFDRAIGLCKFCEKLYNNSLHLVDFYEDEEEYSENELRDIFNGFLYKLPTDFIQEDMDEIKDAVIGIIKESFNTDSSNLDNFVNNLTIGELTALRTIVKKVGSEGVVNVSKICEESGISRQIFSNLFSKLKTDKYASIKNMGMKGTQIKFLNSEILEV